MDYADQRYYASAYGRFNTPDPKSGNGMDPGTLNRYAYVSGDPINRNDPRGLCAVMIAGSKMGADNSPEWATEAAALGADVAYPNSGEGIVASVGSVIQQGFTPNDSTAAALSAILYALSSNSGLIDIVAYSAGAGAFTAAYSELSAAQQARIGFVQYISPGANGQLANVQGTTGVVLGSGVLDDLATQVGTVIPYGVPVQNSSCSHTDYACLFQAASPGLNLIASNGPCQSPEVFSRTGQPATAPFVGDSSAPIFSTPPWFFVGTYDLWNPIFSVDSTITFE